MSDITNNPNITVETGNKVVIASGVAIAVDKDSDFTITLNFDEHFSFIVNFSFKEDASIKEASLQKKVDNGKIFITCTNFNDFIGVGTLKPLDLATYGDDKKMISLLFWVRTPEEKLARELTYCFYLEK